MSALALPCHRPAPLSLAGQTYKSRFHVQLKVHGNFTVRWPPKLLGERAAPAVQLGFFGSSGKVPEKHMPAAPSAPDKNIREHFSVEKLLACVLCCFMLRMKISPIKWSKFMLSRTYGSARSGSNQRGASQERQRPLIACTFAASLVTDERHVFFFWLRTRKTTRVIGASISPPLWASEFMNDNLKV